MNNCFLSRIRIVRNNKIQSERWTFRENACFQQDTNALLYLHLKSTGLEVKGQPSLCAVGPGWHTHTQQIARPKITSKTISTDLAIARQPAAPGGNRELGPAPRAKKPHQQQQQHHHYRFRSHAFPSSALHRKSSKRTFSPGGFHPESHRAHFVTMTVCGVWWARAGRRPPPWGEV